jgi:6-phosphogluconolactonase
MKYAMCAMVGVVCLAGAVALHAAGPNAPGAVYTATNAAAGNEILMYDRASDGSLSFAGAAATGGTGTSAGLGNQGGLALTNDGRYLLVVNAGSNDLSVLRVTSDGLALRDRQSSGGVRPISVTVAGRLVYVLNAGGGAGASDSVVGFWLSQDGRLSMIAGSARGLSGVSTGPAQVSLSPDGGTLVVTEKATNVLDVFPVGFDGTLGTRTSYASSGATPFGFAFGKRGQFFVSEAFGGAPDASAVSAYQVADNGALQVITPSLPDTESAACWLVVTTSGRFLYVTNAASGSISGYAIRPDGTISLLDANGVTASTGAGSAPIDLAFAENDQFLYALNSGTGSIGGFAVQNQGKLRALGNVVGLPATANGLVAR